VEVFVYLCAEGENGEWNGLNAGTKAIQAPRPPASLVQPAPDGLRELQYVALEIKKLIIRNGVLPDDIAVVVRTGTHDTSRAHEVLERAGIPTTARIRRPLVDVPAIKAVVQLLRAAAQDWPYHPLRQVIESAYFDIDLDLRSIDRIAQERRVSGLDNWARQVNRLHEMAGSDDERRSMMRRGLFEDRLGRDCQALGELIAHVAPLSHPRDLPAWIDLTMQILKPGSLDFRARLCRPAGDHWDVVRLDQQAVEFLYRLLREWRTLARRGPDLDVGAWYRELHVFLRSNEMAVGTPQQTGVHILEAHEAVCVPFAATFVIHANDGEFPRRESSGNIFSDGEQEILFPLGIPVPPYHVRQARERALWRAVTGNARVTVSYRTADANGVPLLPSVMVPAHDPSSEIPRTDFIWSEPFNQPQDDLATVERLRRSAGSGTRTVIPSPNATTVKRAIVNAVAELQRREARPDSSVTPGAPSAWNGHITDPLVLDHLAQRFGPERTWSASQLETYAQCPFVFLLERVLYLTDSAPAEEATTALTVGGAAHDILEGFHRRYDGNLQEGLTDDARVLLWEVVLDVCGARERNHDEWIGMPVLWEVTKRDLVLRLEEYLDVELTKGFKHQRPLRTEIEFGNESPLSLRGVDVLGNVVTLKLRGRIDRIDEDTRNGDLYVIDYKLGGTPSPRGYEDGSVLQVPLYVAAAEQLLGRDVAQGCYRSIRKKTMTAAGIKADDPRARRVLTYAMSIPGRVRAGLFEACATASRGWPDYGPGQDVIRTSATLPNGTNRFDG
jgi:ATP-dependent helicase/DNAse subunit B